MKKISRHAVEQYLLKVCNIRPEEAKEKTVKKVENNIILGVKNGKEVNLNPRDAVVRLLNNDCKEATYFYYRGVLFVVVDGCVVTCYPYKKEKLACGRTTGHGSRC